MQLQYRPANDRVMNLGYRFRRGNIEQVDGSLAWPIAREWSAYARMVYSLEDKATLDQFAGLEYRSCCWRLRLVARRYVSNRDGDLDTSVLLQLELNGLSSVGAGADTFLERSIRGYSFSPPEPLKPAMKPLRACPLAVVLAFMAPAARALLAARLRQTRELSSSGVLLDRIAAVVNDGVVLTSQLDEQTEEVIARLRQQNTELPPRNVLRRADPRAPGRRGNPDAARRSPRHSGVRTTCSMARSTTSPSATTSASPICPQALAQQGIDYRTFRDEMRQQLTLQLLRQRDVIGRINISPRELEQFMARQQNAPDQNAEYNVSHILISVPVTASPEQIEAREERAREVHGKAKGGEDFAQLAVTYSESSTNIEGGSLGWRRGSQLPSIVAELIAQMKPGEVSEPIRTPSGFHIFRLNEMRGGRGQAVVSQVHARHILLRTNELEDDQTVAAEARDDPRARADRRRRLRGAGGGDVAGSGLGRRWRRSGLGRPRHVRAGIREAAR